MISLIFLFLLFSENLKIISSEEVHPKIQKGIEKWIEKETEKGNGYFNLKFEKKILKLKLVRVHTEYLAKLDAKSYFACVDLADISGDVYDVDFFLKGGLDDMKVTETYVHKKNGKPFYYWKQKKDGTWHRIPQENASPREMGIIEGKDSFEFSYKFDLPDIKKYGRAWIPIPSENKFQKVKMISIKAPEKRRFIKDNQNNTILFFELKLEDSKRQVEIVYKIERYEQGIYEEEGDRRNYLKEERYVPLNEKFEKIASDILKNKKEKLMQARTIYDYVIDNLKYQRYGPGWGKGDAIYACDYKTGNCSDFHSLFIAISRAAGIPARFVMGVAIPAERNSGGIDGYHCWAEFYTDGKWWPVDLSEANKYSPLSTYYFGHQPANRIELSRGRDLIFEPSPPSSPVNFLAYPILEIDKKEINIRPNFSFKRDLKKGGE